MRKLIIFLLLFFINVGLSQNTWRLLTTREQLNSVTSCSPGKLFVVGSYGVVVKKNSDSYNWIFLAGLRDTTLRCVYFINENTGWIAANRYPWGGESIIYKTSNSGYNWNIIFSFPESLASIYFVDDQIGWACGSNGSITKTTNGGYNWNSQISNSTVTFVSVYMLNINTGWVAGGYGFNRRVMKTTNGGINWFTQLSDTGMIIQKIYFHDSNTGWVLDDPVSILRSTNGGFNWIPYSIGEFANFQSFFFVNNSVGWMVGQGGRILKTTNSGVNWYLQRPNQGSDDSFLNDVYFKDPNTGWAVGRKSNIIKTTNGGNNWFVDMEVLAGHCNDIVIKNQRIGWVVTSLGSVSKTTDGGLTWFTQLSPTNVSLNSLFFVDTNLGWACSSDGKIVKTTNGGVSWQSYVAENQTAINRIQFININTGWIVGNEGLISRTSNGGINWQKLTGITLKKLYSLCFTNVNNGIVVGDSIILFTSNGGLNWICVMNEPKIFRSVFFLNNYTGWISSLHKPYPIGGYLRSTYKTTDSGLNWELLKTWWTSTSLGYVSDLFFKDTSNGWVCTKNGEVIYTLSGASGNWYNYLLPSRKPHNSFAFDSLTNIWICGDSGTVISNLPLSLIGILNNTGNISSFSLSQNYPNPFNPVARIKYEIPLSRGVSNGRGVLVRLIIYDILGREIETLVNDNKKPGTYEVEWDGSRYASGVYFYRLITDDFVETKKMVLIK